MSNMYDFLCRNIETPELRRDFIYELAFEQFKFTWRNPTGHWRLSLENRSQRAVVTKLFAINKSESEYSKNFSNRQDTSQSGNWFNFRNCRFNSNALDTFVIEQNFIDNLPLKGVLEFDDVSTKRPDAKNIIADAVTAAVAAVDAAGQEYALGNEDFSDEKAIVSSSIGETISPEQFSGLLLKLGFSKVTRVSRANVMFAIMELQLAVTKYYFTVSNVMGVMELFCQDSLTQAKVVVCMHCRIRDLWNMDMLLRTLDITAQREILLRLGCLNVLNPLKLAFDYCISLRHLDNRILLQILLEISPTEGTDQIKENPKTQLSVLTFYGALHRITSSVREETMLFSYSEVGYNTTIVSWNLRRDALKKFLVGNSPMNKDIFRIIAMHREMEQHSTLGRGPIDIQYAAHLKAMKAIRQVQARQATDRATTQALRKSVLVAPPTPSSPAPTTTTTRLNATVTPAAMAQLKKKIADEEDDFDK